MDINKNETASKRMLPAALIAAIVAIGAAAIYVTSGKYGNGSVEQTAVCNTDPATISAVDSARKGEVAGMLMSQPQTLENISFLDAQGRTISLDDFQGKAILVNLWATWCVPCREEMPALDRLRNKMASSSFDVVAINIDTGPEDKPARFYKENAITSLELYRDPSMKSFNEFKRRSLALGLPATALVDENGCVIAHMNGPAEWDSTDAMALVDAIVR